MVVFLLLVIQIFFFYLFPIYLQNDDELREAEDFCICNETLEPQNPIDPELCQCKYFETSKERIFGGKLVSPLDLTFAGSLYFKLLKFNLINTYKEGKVFDDALDYEYKQICSCR